MYLNCHTYHSLKYGLLSVKQLVKLAVEAEITHLALTDINNTSCLIEFISECRDHGITPVAGIEFRQGDKLLYIGLARNTLGFSRLNNLLDGYLVHGHPLPPRAPLLQDVVFVYDFRQVLSFRLRADEYVGVRPQHLHQWYKSKDQFDSSRTLALLTVTLSQPDDWPIHRLLRCIEHNALLSRAADQWCCHPDECFRDRTFLTRQYVLYPTLLDHAQRLLENCQIDSSTITVNKRHYLAGQQDDRTLLSQLARTGLRLRYSKPQSLHWTRLQSELDMIFQLHFEAYFLITWDIVQYAKRKQFRHVGRGSGANSLVAYCLEITDVDPLQLNLYFERFINPYRPVPPDFDLDFSWDERDEVVRYVQQRHGPNRVGLLASYQTFKGKSTVRALGKVYGLAPKEIDLLVQEPLAKQRHHPLGETIFNMGKHLLQLPSHLSMHVGGVVISEDSLQLITASQLMPKGFAVLQLDMKHAAEWGMHKYDLLSQRGTGHIKEAIRLVSDTGLPPVDISNMDMVVNDQETFRLLRTPGGCIGCFYLESPAMRGLLAKVPCRNYQDLVAITSIIRPGVAKSGMMQKYIERFHDPSEIKYLHPVMATLLQETYGIMVYQEDVMKVVHHLANFDLFEADLLRRLMTGKRKSWDDLLFLKRRFFENCQSLGTSPSDISAIWKQIESFSGYSFCKAHSATYTAESLQSLYLKAHHPLQFMVAVINNEGGFYPTEVYVREAIRLGGEVEPPCINRSSWHTRIEGRKIFLGLKLIRGLKLASGENILKVRADGRVIDGLQPLISYLDPSQLDLLIEVGALRSTGKERQALFFERLQLSNPLPRLQLPLFAASSYQYHPEVGDDSLKQAISQCQLLGFTIGNPFLLLNRMVHQTHILAGDMVSHTSKDVCMVGYYIIEKPVTTESGAHMCFVTWYDKDLSFFDSVHFPPVLANYPLRGRGFYLLKGKVEVDHGYPTLRVETCMTLLLISDLSDADSLFANTLTNETTRRLYRSQIGVETGSN